MVLREVEPLDEARRTECWSVIDSGEGLLGPIILSSHSALPLKISHVKLKSPGYSCPRLSLRTLSRRERPVSACCHCEEDCSQRVLDTVALSL